MKKYYLIIIFVALLVGAGFFIPIKTVQIDSYGCSNLVIVQRHNLILGDTIPDPKSLDIGVRGPCGPIVKHVLYLF